jgi:hypothetical protein
MDQNGDLKNLKEQINHALREENGDASKREELKNMLDALENYEPEIKEEWTAEDELLYAQKGKPRIAHKPSTNTSNSLPIELPQSFPANSEKPAQTSNDIWKGVFEKNVKTDGKNKPHNK